MAQRETLSHFLRRPEFRFLVRMKPDGSKVYKPFQWAVLELIPNATADTFPIAFSCPLFTGSHDAEPNPASILQELLPENGKLPTEQGIHFLCEAIDFLSAGRGLSPLEIADIVEQFEQNLSQAGFSVYGRRKHIAV